MIRLVTVLLFIVWAWAMGRYYAVGNMLEILAALIVAFGLMRVLSGSRHLSR
jgi:hypothetical protein